MLNTEVTPVTGTPKAELEFVPGAIWVDTSGKPIQAHGGGILSFRGIFYWYGEDKSLGYFNKVGVSCYSSRDLYIWNHEGTALPVAAMPAQYQENGVLERPKVIYNWKTRKFVMWMHLDNSHYSISRAGVAVSDQPKGPFVFQSEFRPVREDCTYRDMNLFLDDDNRAYAIYSGEDNATVCIVRLNEAFTAPELPAIKGQTWSRAIVDQSREAPAPFKYRGKYYLITSGTSGWDPNPAKLATADHILGPWTLGDNPCVGPDADTTFHSQSTFVLPLPGKPEGRFIYMGDRWNAKDLADSRYVWLPLEIKNNGSISLSWKDRWSLSSLKSM